MRQCIDADMRCEWLGHRKSQLVIHDGGGRHELGIEDHHVRFTRRIRNNGNFCSFASRSRRCGNRHEWWPRLGNAVVALELAHRPRVRCRHTDHLRHVERTASADCQDGICVQLTKVLGSSDNVLVRGIGLEIREEFTRDSLTCEGCANLRDEIRRCKKWIDDEQRPLSMKGYQQLCRLRAASAAGDDCPGGIEACSHSAFPSDYDSLFAAMSNITSKHVEVKVDDGTTMLAWVASPAGEAPKRGIMVFPEIF